MMAGSIAQTSAKPSPQSRVFPPESSTCSPLSPGPAASLEPPLTVPSTTPPRAFLTCTLVTSSLTSRLNAAGNLACDFRVHVRGAPTWYRCTHMPSVVADHKNSPSCPVATHAGSRRWWPLLPAHVECEWSAATCAPLRELCTQIDPSLCARNRSVPPPPPARDPQSMNLLHADTPSRRNLRTSVPSSASMRTILSGASGSA
mmetsp:Transcript_9183/g.41833  ORF Transcript_9183/g.41833 Transcript_9183/m.41833 type:complete len:202 (-) Transcript_9183:1042-1647(-)